MATTNNYVTVNTLKANNQIILGYLAERDTRIATSENDIAEIQRTLDDLKVGLHYCGVVKTLPAISVQDGALYYFDEVVMTEDESEVSGWFFYSDNEQKWLELGSGNGVSDMDICKLPEDAIDFTIEI